MNGAEVKGPVVQMGQQIVVLDRGYVYSGEVTREGDMVRIEQAQNVRRWGTTRGLGQLAESGKTESTVLDPAGTVTAPLKSVIHFIACLKKL